MSGKSNLTHEDVSRLLSDPSAATRAETAAKIAGQFDRGEFGEGERKVAEEIFRLMVKDAEVRVREALSKHLKESANVPHDVAMILAQDVDSVALPMIEASSVLTDADLLEIVRSQGPAKQTAVAGRASVSEAVSNALVETKNETVVARLVGNEGAKISDAAFNKVIEVFPKSEKVQANLVNRSKLPITVSEKLVTLVSEKLRAKLMTRPDLPADLAGDLVLQTRERAVLGLSSDSEEGDVEVLVRQLKANGRLTPSIVLRAVCMGDLRFFEASLAEGAGVPLVNARILIHDSGSLGFKSLFEKAGMPGPFYTAMRAAVDVAHDTQYDGEERDRERYSRRMIERILTQYGDLGVEFENDDLEYLLTKMNQLPPTLHGG